MYPGILHSSGSEWKQLRKFAIKGLHELGVGKRTVEERIQNEAQSLSTELAKHAGKAYDPGSILVMAVNNIISSIAFGDRYSALKY